MQCGLLGRSLGHSYSPQIHGFFGDYPYDLYEVEPDDLETFLTSKDFHGLNVTIPYKKAVIPYCSELSATAKKLGAVNTIVRKTDGSLLGHNTDYFGFQSMLDHSGIQIAGKKVLVLGTGGASVTVTEVLKERGARVVSISRSGKDNYGNLYNHADASLIVNCTPVGMYPNCPNAPLSLDQFPELEGVLDLIYNPANTKLLMDAQSRGLKAENGLWMLVAQAKESAEWFLGHKLPDSIIATVHAALRAQMQNIVLIGMPGCGKSTIGQLLSSRLNRPYFDADLEICLKAGKSIPDIFSQEGEVAFRSIETSVLEDLGKKSGIILATGGGCVTNNRNYPLLHQNSTIIWLQRSIDSLSTEGRPLSKAGQLEAMYLQRKPLYEQFSDFSVENSGSPEETASKIIHLLKNEGLL